MKFSVVIVLLFGISTACTPDKGSRVNESSHSETIGLKYAKGFTITQLEHGKLIEVTQPYPGAKTGFRYLLLNKDKSIPHNITNAKIISVPVSRVVCTSTSHIPLLDYLNESEALVGFPTTDYISSVKMRALIAQGLVTDLGIDKGMDLERLALLKPDITMAYSLSGDFGQFKKIEELGIPIIVNAEFLEEHPLGRAEWIKFMAAFFNKEKLADSIFRAIEHNYYDTYEKVSHVQTKPTVMSGIVYGDTWFLPGGENYASQLLHDAGGNYLWSDTPSNGFLELSFESVYEKAHQADLWIGVASFKALAEIEKAEIRYTKFKAFQTGQVYTYDARKGARGGSEFLELGYLRPDIILNDLVKIIHPNALPEHTLYFHQKLQ
ncbi:MAG: ABC transporter substrate-binding protein [Cyclobacteriaceae bacterium]|nr:ABC transporter substrate-binding protein [Cyclobacteriaceae bacterium]